MWVYCGVVQRISRRQVLLAAAGVSASAPTLAQPQQPAAQRPSEPPPKETALEKTALEETAKRPPEPPFAANTLFVITRSKNRNTVYYDLRRDAEGITSRTDPLDVYWRMYAADGEREELTWAERQWAYGYELLSSVARSGFRARLQALPERPLEVWRQESGRYVASCSIARSVGTLRQVHVVTDETWRGPVVRYIDIVGIDLETGQPLVERITKS